MVTLQLSIRALGKKHVCWNVDFRSFLHVHQCRNRRLLGCPSFLFKFIQSQNCSINRKIILYELFIVLRWSSVYRSWSLWSLLIMWNLLIRGIQNGCIIISTIDTWGFQGKSPIHMNQRRIRWYEGGCHLIGSIYERRILNIVVFPSYMRICKSIILVVHFTCWLNILILMMLKFNWNS